MRRKTITTRLITQYLTASDKNNSEEMVKKLIQNNELNQKEYDEYLEVWEKSANLKDYEEINIDNDWRKVRSKMYGLQPIHKSSSLSFYLKIAAVFILMAGTTFYFIQKGSFTKKIKTEYFETLALNSAQRIELSDGSIITLNKNSKLISTNNYGKTNRDIILDGEAFFEIAKNEQIPFRVYMQNSTVEVRGTSFNISTKNNKVVVGVFTGHVLFYETGNSKNGVDLIPENTGVFEPKSNTFFKEEFLELTTIEWRYNGPGIIRVPAGIIFKNLAQQHHKQLEMDDKFLEQISYRIKPEVSLQDQILNLNQLGSQLFVIEDTGDKLVVKKR